eukprot:5003954-Amphidinium_carterae.1
MCISDILVDHAPAVAALRRTESTDPVETKDVKRNLLQSLQKETPLLVLLGMSAVRRLPTDMYHMFLRNSVAVVATSRGNRVVGSTPPTVRATGLQSSRSPKTSEKAVTSEQQSAH